MEGENDTFLEEVVFSGADELVGEGRVDEREGDYDVDELFC